MLNTLTINILMLKYLKVIDVLDVDVVKSGN
jgi:hypothetical protein